MVLLHVSDLQVFQDHTAVAVRLHHVLIMVLSGCQKVQTIAEALACCRDKETIWIYLNVET